jgi:protein-L-isoaspartate(D-aspartate) O-methyltransferase
MVKFARSPLRVGAALAVTLLLQACLGTAESPAPSGTPTNPPVAEESTLIPTLPPATETVYAQQREQMVQQGVIGWGIEDERVIEAMRNTPRHEFVPTDYLHQAYENHPLPIGYGQTISQPYIVALMTQELDLESGDVVLEIGTGSGYQAAVLAELDLEVYTMEIIEPLANAAEARLERLGYGNIEAMHADGYNGWEEHAPYDAIIVTAAPDHVPQPLLVQLKIGGVMVIPVGPVGGYQELWRIMRVDESSFSRESLGGVRFVPLTRQEGAE